MCWDTSDGSRYYYILATLCALRSVGRVKAVGSKEQLVAYRDFLHKATQEVRGESMSVALETIGEWIDSFPDWPKCRYPLTLDEAIAALRRAAVASS